MPDGSVALAIGDEASWTESKHPRGEDGKFTSGSGAGGGGPGPTAKKGQVSNSIAVPLLAHGFKLKKTSGGDAIYEHPDGHEIAVKPVPEGKKYSSGFVVKGGGEGGGGIAIEKALANLGLKGKEKTPKPADVQEALGALGVGPKAAKSAKPPPSFEHPNPQFQAKLAAFGAAPVKATATTQLYSLPNGGSVLVKTKPKMFYGSPTSQYKWKVMNPDGSLAGWNGEGKSYTGLGTKLQNVTGINPTTGKKSVIPPGGATGFHGGSTYMSPGAITPEPTMKYNFPGGKSVVVGQETDSWAITDPNGGVKTGKGQADLDKALATPPTVAMPPAAKVLGNPQTKEAVTFPGGIQQATGYGLSTGETVYVANNGDWKIIKNDGNAAFGNGQESLNQEFELLHPRGAGGQFLKKPGEVLPPIQKDIANLLESAGAHFTSSNGANNLHYFKIQGDATLVVSNGGSFVYNHPKSGIHLSGQGVDVLQQKLSHAGVNFGAASAQQAPAAKPPVSVSKLKNVGPQLGSNPGGQYEDETGQKFYVKKTKSEDHAKNENLAASLYQLAGTNTFQYRKSEDDKTAVITEMVPLQAKQISQLTPQQRAAARLDFATHVWTANWDAAGMTGDNQGVVNGKVTTLDVGGSLAYRAQGGEKGHLFGTDAGEWETLRNSAKNPQTAALFANMTHAELKASVAKVAAVKPDMIRDAVKAAGYEGAAATALADKLIARRESVITKLNQEVNKPAPPPPPPPPPAFVAPFDKPKYDPHEAATLTAAMPVPTPEERKAVYNYTDGHYDTMNEAFRYGYHAGPKSDLNHLVAYLDKASLPQEVIVSRKVSGKYAEFLKSQAAHHGAEMTEYAPASTAINPEKWSGAVQMILRIPKGSKAAYVDSISANKGETELLLQRGARYKVITYQKTGGAQGLPRIYCEVTWDEADAKST